MISSLFKQILTDPVSKARLGTLSLPHGEVQTPAFMPVGTNACVKAITHEELWEMGYRLILGNTYHLYLRPGIEVVEKFGGLHAFSTWKGNILTDSGGFQVFSLSALRKIREEGVLFRSHLDGSSHEFTPEKVISLQKSFGSDILMNFDICSAYGISEQKTLEDLRITTSWAKRCLATWQQFRDEGFQGLLFGIIQGGFYKSLRERSAQEILALDTPGIAIGGLSIGEPKKDFFEYLQYTASLLPPDKPRYVMGIGTPDYIFACVENGIDLFDCVYPTRISRNSAVLTPDGLRSLKKIDFRFDENPIDPNCGCKVCRRYSRGYIRHLFKANEILGPMLTTHHNLYFMADLLNKIRASIRKGVFLAFKKEFLGRFYEEIK